MTTVTIDMYSGVPNPTFDLTPEQEKALEKVLSSCIGQKTLQQSSPNIGVLGYRGFSVSSPKDETSFQHLLVVGGIIDVKAAEKSTFSDTGNEIELMLLEFAKAHLKENEVSWIQDTIQKKNHLTKAR